MSLAEIDQEIKRLTRRIEAVQREGTSELRSTSKPRPLRPQYTGLPDLEKDLKVPKGFERAPITHDVDPEKAARLAKAEAVLREALLAVNRQDTLALVRKIRRHQTRNPLGKPVTVREEREDRLKALVVDINK